MPNSTRSRRAGPAHLVEQYINEDGKAAMRLTPKGVQVARSMAMPGDEDADVVLDGED